MHGSVKLGLVILAIIVLVIVFTAFRKPNGKDDGAGEVTDPKDDVNNPPPPPPVSNTIPQSTQNDLQQIVRQIKDDVDNNSCWYCVHNYAPYDNLLKYLSNNQIEEVKYADAYMRSLNHSWGLYKTINSVIGTYLSGQPGVIKNGLVTMGLNY